MWPTAERAVCAALTAAGAALLAARPGARAARAAWLALLVVGLAHALALNLHSVRRANINLIHHYLGAKYAIPYGEFYRLVQAALDEPPIGIRDLDHPDRLVDSEPAARRAYYLDLLRRHQVSFDPRAPLDTLARLARTSGAVAGDARALLRSRLPENRIEPFRRDVRWAVSGLDWQVLTADYGFNGSPFYALLRRLDPTLHRPFGPPAILVAVLAQVAGSLALVWVIGEALAFDLTGKLAAAALLFASWDFVGYALSGLVFAELWVPVAVAALAMRRRRAALAGIAVAWAGLLKLFPFLLLLPALVHVAPRRARAAGGVEARDAGVRPWPFLGACVGAAAILAAAAAGSGRSWWDFLHKIRVEFQSGFCLVNSVSQESGLLVLGVDRSPLTRLVALAALAFLSAMFAGAGREPSESAIPRRMLVLIGATGWLVRNWLNYYAVIPLLMLPHYAREHRVGAALAAASMAVAFACPEFSSPLLLADPALHALKLLPYLAVPAWLTWLELRTLRFGPRVRRAAVTTVAVLLVATLAETWREHATRALARDVSAKLDDGDALGALIDARSIVRVDPWNATAWMNQGIALATLGRLDEAGAAFARAVRLAPADPAALDNEGRLLMIEGRLPEAGARFEAARREAPTDVRILAALAELRTRQGRRSESTALLERALELEPENVELAGELERIRGIGTAERAARTPPAAPDTKAPPERAP